jgi:single-stranded-DNA-specific exonuclease
MKWKILNKKNQKQKTEFKTEEIIKTLLANRGIKSKKEIEEFLNPKKPEDLTSKDVGLDSKQIKKATQRIKKAIKNGEKVIVYGDYDTDGVCGTAILWESLHQLKANVLPFIPKREEGYGLKVERIEEMAKEGVKLIITVDQGIVASSQVEHANKLGVDIIITDHHVLGEKKPKALAIVHTTKLAGCGVAWLFSKYLQGKSSGLDLVTMGVITDMVSLIGANRSLVKYGLKELQKTKRPGLRALYDFAGLNKNKIGVFEVGYIVGPRINAAGRMDDPMESLRLICTKDELKAIGLAQKIDQRTRERQILTEKTIIHAREIWLKEGGENNLIFVGDESYQEGIVGLVASRLSEEFYRPAVVFSLGKEFSKASARSIKEFNIIEAIRSCEEILVAHGGHPRAAGLTVETTKISLLKERLMKIAQNRLKGQELSPSLKIDLELNLEEVNFELYQQIMKLEPFGEGNPQPVFVSYQVSVVDARTVGNGQKHLKLRLASPLSRCAFEAIAFGLGNLFPQLTSSQKIDIAYNLLVDEWNGNQRLQLKIKDIKMTGV